METSTICIDVPNRRARAAVRVVVVEPEEGVAAVAVEADAEEDVVAAAAVNLRSNRSSPIDSTSCRPK